MIMTCLHLEIMIIKMMNSGGIEQIRHQTGGFLMMAATMNHLPMKVLRSIQVEFTKIPHFEHSK